MNEITKAALVLGGGVALFAALKELVFKDKSSAAKNETDDRKAASATDRKDATVALRAYKAALKAGEDRDALSELNRELIKTYGLRVMRRKKDQTLVVLNPAGDEVLEDGA